MGTECKQMMLGFQPAGKRDLVGQFDGGTITSDGGAVLLGEVEKKRSTIKQFAACFVDHRTESMIEHTVEELVAQRVFGLALGYEYLNDHDQLRTDPLLAALVPRSGITGEHRRRVSDRGKALAGKSTLNRLELYSGDPVKDREYKKISVDEEAVARYFVEMFLQAHDEAPKEIILDLDATDDPLHGEQEGRFFHGYEGNYCYPPLYIFRGDFLLCAKLRTADQDQSAGAVEELERIVDQIRQRWAEVRIIIRADSGFAREEIMSWCEAHEADYVLGLAKNARLLPMIEQELARAKECHQLTGKAWREFAELRYQTLTSWSQSRRVAGKAEYLEKGPNPRFVVTSIGAREIEAKPLYEDLYRGRGEMENRIKEQQLQLFADRTSTATIKANQLRLWFSSVAYVLINEVRRVGLANTEMAHAQCGTIRLKLLKMGAQIPRIVPSSVDFVGEQLSLSATVCARL